MRYLHLADKHDLPRIVTIQNPYSLLNRSFEVGLAEVSQYEGVELLAHSCLGFGTLTGKYLNGAKPAGARNTLFSRFTRYSGEQTQKPSRRMLISPDVIAGPCSDGARICTPSTVCCQHSAGRNHDGAAEN